MFRHHMLFKNWQQSKQALGIEFVTQSLAATFAIPVTVCVSCCNILSQKQNVWKSSVNGEQK